MAVFTISVVGVFPEKNATDMIYIAQPAADTVIRIPRTALLPYEGAQLTLRSTVGLQETEIDLASVEASPLYYTIEGDFSALATAGEYEYRLTAGDALLASGILVVGELPDVTRLEYEKTIEYEQYHPEHASTPDVR